MTSNATGAAALSKAPQLSQHAKTARSAEVKAVRAAAEIVASPRHKEESAIDILCLMPFAIEQEL